MSELTIVAITRVKNERDIIEAFVRHNATHVTRMLIEDDGSSDGTCEILASLRDEGLPIDILTFPAIGCEQSMRVTRLAHIALDAHAADWIIPLDADEFLEPPGDRSLRDVLAGHDGTLLRVGWSNFVWRETLDAAELNPVIRLVERLPARPDHTKVVIPAALIRNASFEITIGSHDLICDGQYVGGTQTYDIALCHYPIRSLDQYVGKLVTGYLQIRCSPFFSVGLFFQYNEPFEKILNGDASLAAFVEAQSHRYSALPDATIVETPSHAPLRYAGAPLSFTGTGDRALPNILAYAAKLADHHRGEILRTTAIVDAITQMTPHEGDASALERLERLRLSTVSLEASHAAGLDAIADLRRQLEDMGHQVAELRGEGEDLTSQRDHLAAALSERDVLIDALRVKDAATTDALSQARRTIEDKDADLAFPLVRLARRFYKSSRPDDQALEATSTSGRSSLTAAQRVQSFWFGEALSAMTAMCLRSFLDFGHQVDLYSFQSLDVPAGIRLRDAREFFDEAEMFVYESGIGQGSPAAFSNLFRYRLLAERGGWWVDTDVACLSERLPDDEVFFAREDESLINVAVMRFPANHPVMLRCLEEARRIGRSVQWGHTGPYLMTRVVAECGLNETAHDTRTCYPIPWRDATDVVAAGNAEAVAAKIGAAPLLHLWNSPLHWAGVDPNARPPASSYLRRLADRHPVALWREPEAASTA